MSMTWRAIIMIAELVVIVSLGIFHCYKTCKRTNSKKTILKESMPYIFSIILLTVVFCFSFSSFIFFSSVKFFLTSSIFLGEMFFLIPYYLEKQNVGNKKVRSANITCLFIFIIGVLAISYCISATIETTLLLQDTIEEKEVIVPYMLSENQIGYTTDEDGNITSYCFYYKNGDDIIFEEFEPSEYEIVEVQDEDTYIEKTITTKTFIDTEKKKMAEGYVFEEKEEKITVYINLIQTVEIKKNNN